MNRLNKDRFGQYVFLIIAFQFNFIPQKQAAINPIYKECLQRGYTLAAGDYCVFPDSTRCLIDDFNKGRCGQKWFTEDYCVEEGQYIWDADKCCSGLVAYLPKGIAGQARCRAKLEVFLDRYYLNRMWVWGVVIVSGLFAWFRKKRKHRRNSANPKF